MEKNLIDRLRIYENYLKKEITKEKYPNVLVCKDKILRINQSKFYEFFPELKNYSENKK